MSKELTNFIGGHWVGAHGEKHEIINPADGKSIVATLKYSTPEDVGSAVAAAAEAFPAWRAVPVVQRCRILFHVKELLEHNSDDLARHIVAENGKTLGEAEGDVRRGIEVVEFAAGSPHLMKGEYIEDIARRVDGYIYREPLGVVAGACPFNFPAMVPMWMFPIAIACGNTFVLKPSEKCPVTATAVAEVFAEGGLPEGVLNIVHGARETFEALITAPRVKAVSFVGSTAAAKNVWELATRHHKRVQALGGAKNYIIVMPDAAPENTVNGIIGSSLGCAGERCMASSVLVVVGEADGILKDVVKAASELKVGPGFERETQMGPLVSAAHRKRVEDYIALGIEEGAQT
ncbi:MAG: aldehyde dehydrogenase family protein, partial [Planctomycetota bacterium]